MARLSVPQAAERLGVSPARVRQRIDEGSLIADRVGGRWLVDLSVVPELKRRGRPVNPELVWDAIQRVDAAAILKAEGGLSFEDVLRLVYADDWRPQAQSPHPLELAIAEGSVVLPQPSRSSRRRAFLRVLHAAEALGGAEGQPALDGLLQWLGARADRKLYRAALPDLEDLRGDERVALSGLSDPRSGMEDPRVVEGYVALDDLAAVVNDYWLDPPRVDSSPNVFLHVAPGRPDRVSPLLLAADLFEHEGPREQSRARELAIGVFA